MKRIGDGKARSGEYRVLQGALLLHWISLEEFFFIFFIRQKSVRSVIDLKPQP